MLSSRAIAARLATAIIATTTVAIAGNSITYAAKPSGSGGGTSSPVTVIITAPSNGASVTSSLLISGSASTAAHGASIASVKVSVDSGAYQTAMGTTSWSVSVSNLSGGMHSITALAADSKGNTASASITVSVSTSTSSPSNTTATPPTSTMVWPRYPNAIVTGTYTLQGASSDSTYSVAKEQWAIDGAVVATGTSAYGLSYNWDTSTVPLGSHTVAYTTWNSAGASSSVSTPITVNTYSIKRVAVILYNFSNQTPPTTPQQVDDWTFGTTRSVAGYYRENSYGKLLLGGQYNTAGDVFGFYTIPYAEPTTASCDFNGWDGAAVRQATAAGVDLGGYDVYLLTASVPAGCGSGTGGGVEDIVPWNNPLSPDDWIAFAGHELGHSFGIHHHADSWTCVDTSGHSVQVGGACTSTEYGDPYDIMAAGNVEHMNAYEKGQLGFFGPGNAIAVTTPGTYSLAPLTAPSSAVQSIRIPRAWNASGTPIDFYYLEYRQPTAYDVAPPSVQDYDGVLIREAPDYSQAYTQSNLIDTTPGSMTYPGVHDNFDAPLKPGMYFQDLSVGISVTTLTVTSSGATIQVGFGAPSCVRVQPTVSMSTTSISAPPGTTIDYPFTVTNNDSPACGPSSIAVTSSLPLGFTQSPSTTTLSLCPSGATSSWMLYVTSTLTAAVGSYSFSETSINDSSGQYATASATIGVS